MKKILIIILFVSVNLFGQKSKIEIGLGISFEAGLFNVFESQKAKSFEISNEKMGLPYSPEKNIQGFGLPISIKTYLKDSKSSFEYAPTIRYDQVSVDFNTNATSKKLLINQAFYFNKVLGKKQASILKIGMTLYNPLVKIVIPKGNNTIISTRESISFFGIDLGLSRELSKKIDVSLISHFFPTGQIPVTASTFNGANYMSLSCKLNYKLRGI